MMNSLVQSPEFTITNEQDLRRFHEPTQPIATQKSEKYLSAYAQEFIRRSPLLCIGTQSAEGHGDVSPRGDPPGFVKVLDSTTLTIPDRPGNNRFDTLVNVLANPNVGILFMIPGFDETLRVNGRAVLSREPELLQSMVIKERVPKLAMVVTVDEVFVHCAKAFQRSHLWSPDALQDPKGMPARQKDS